MTIDEAIKEEQTLYDIAKDKYEKLGIKNCLKRMEEHKQYIEWLEELKAIKDNCDGKCTNCSNTELPNIKDCKEMDIGYSYAYKTDCAGDRYIKAEEVKYLLKCERGKAIDDFVEKLIRYVDCGHLCSPTEARWSDLSVVEMVKKLAEQLKAGGENEI